MSIRNLPLYLVILSAVGLAFGVGYISYPLLHGAPENSTAPVAEAPASTSGSAQTVDAEDMSAYWAAWDILERDFFGQKPDVSTRTYGAIRGMVESFNDPYTYFVEPQPRELERDELAGRFGGIGANIVLTESGYILMPMVGLPAADAGVLEGDLLLLVDDQEVTTQMTLDEIASLVRGPIGSVVTLVVRRGGEAGAVAEELTLSVTRAEMQTPSVEWRLLTDTASGTVGYIVHSLYTERSAEEMHQAIVELEEQGATRYILDLRGNRGGLVSTAVAIADMWLDEGVIFIEQKADGSEVVKSATDGVLTEAPLVVIVDAGSASAAEIVAGALQDNGRASLVGEKTYGKGSVQLIHELPDASSLHVTNAQWLTPNRHPITGNGLQPEVVVMTGNDPLPQAIAVVEAVTIVAAERGTNEVASPTEAGN